ATGATGGEAARLLLERGASVRALAHREDERSRELQQRGAEVVYGNLLNFDAMRSALAEVDRTYFCYPISPGIVHATAQFAQAATELCVELPETVPKRSARGAGKSEAARQHWLSERVFDWSGVPVAHIRPTYFAEWLLYLAPMIRQGVMLAPFSATGRHAPIAAEDQARVIVGMLEKPDAHAGKTYPLFGPVELTHPQIAEIVGRVLGKEVKYQQITLQKFMEVLGTQLPREQNTAAAMYRDPASQAGRTTSLSICTRSRSITRTASLPAPTITSSRSAAGRRSRWRPSSTSTARP